MLSSVRDQDAEDIAAAADRAADAVISYVTEGPDKTMSKFN